MPIEPVPSVPGSRIRAAVRAVLAVFLTAARLGPAGGSTIETRFPAPEGYVRAEAPPDSFASYLRRLPLKPPGADIRLYDGRTRSGRGVAAAVVDRPVGDRDLQQCADAIIRLRADYLLAAGREDEISFRFTSGFRADYARWRRGERIEVRNGEARWRRPAGEGSAADDRDFDKYLETVFMYAGTASLAAELESAPGDDPEIGDVFIRPGYPGHAVIVVDKAVNPGTGGAAFLLAQSFMPAQEIHVLMNPEDPRLSPWYEAGFGNVLRTPEWIFSSEELRRFKDD